MSLRRDLTGQRFGSLTVIRQDPDRVSKNGLLHWLCKCDCGRHLSVRTDNLTRGHTTQCTECGWVHGRNESVFVEGGVTRGETVCGQ
jgi:hypothetical protein